jgi:hypothetical protein
LNDIPFNGLSTCVWGTESALENERAHRVDIVCAARALKDPLVLVTELGEEGSFEAIGLSGGRYISEGLRSDELGPPGRSVMDPALRCRWPG